MMARMRSRLGIVTGHPDQVGIALLAIGAVVLVWWLALSAMGPTLPSESSRQFAVDFRDYWLAAGRMAHGASPYSPEMLSGPIGSQGLDIYRYPPVLAFLLIPLSGLDYITAGAIWDVAGVLALAGALALALRCGGTSLRPRVVLWTAVITVWFFPTLDTLWKGNVECFQALALSIALAGGTRASASAIAAGAWLKLTPVMAVPALLVARGWRALAWLAVASAVLVVPALIWATPGFFDMPSVLVKVAGAGSAGSSNLAPWSWMNLLSGSAEVGSVIRVLSWAGALALVGLSVLAARRPGGWPVALVAATAAGLLAPGALWDHYLLLLLPMGAFAWGRVSFDSKAALLISGFFMTLPGFVLTSSLSGSMAFHSASVAVAAAWFLGVLVYGLWPRSAPAA